MHSHLVCTIWGILILFGACIFFPLLRFVAILPQKKDVVTSENISDAAQKVKDFVNSEEVQNLSGQVKDLINSDEAQQLVGHVGNMMSRASSWFG